MRYTFGAVSNGMRDQVAVDSIMGHSPHTNDMAVCHQHVDDVRLRDVADHVRDWIWQKSEEMNHRGQRKLSQKRCNGIIEQCGLG